MTDEKKGTGTAVATTEAANPLVHALKKAESTLVSFLGTPELAERFWRVTLVLVRRTPDLRNCSAESLVAGMLQSAQLGLELGTEAYLVPFKGEASFIADWKGLVRLAIREGAITGGHGDLVYVDDRYVYRRTGDALEFLHEPKRFGLRADQDTVEAHRKAGCQGVYFIGNRDGALPIVEQMTVDEVEWVRKTYSRVPNGPMWSKSWSRAAIKTAAKRAMKLVDARPDSKLAQAIEVDSRSETGLMSGVMPGDEKATEPYREPRPRQQPKSEAEEEAEVRAEDRKLVEKEQREPGED